MNKTFFKISIFFFLLFLSPALFSQVSINSTGTAPSANAVLDLNTGNANNRGLIVPNVTLGAALTTFNPPIANAATTKDVGMIVYNSVATNQPIGYYYWNGTTWVGISSGTNGATSWSLNGNSGTSPSTNFIGTTDNEPLNIRIQNIWAGTIGTTNTALGFYTYTRANTNGNYNTAYGSFALYNALASNFNTAIGYNVLAYGNGTTGCTGVGYLTLLNDYNGAYNTAVGYDCALNTSIGISNTAIGDSALYMNKTGSYNTTIGTHADVASNNLTNATAIGANSTVPSNNMVVLGGTSVTQLGFNGALEPYYNSNYQSGTSGQVLTSQGAGVAPQWTTINTGANYLSDTVGGNGPIPQVVTKQYQSTILGSYLTLADSSFMDSKVYMKSYVANHSTYNYLSDTVGGNGSKPALVTLKEQSTLLGSYLTITDSSFISSKTFMESYVAQHSGSGTNYLADTLGGVGSKPVLITTKLLKTDTTNANSYLVGNAYMKSYVANNSTNYLNDTSSGSGSKATLVTKKYISSYVTLSDSNGGSGTTPQFVTKQGIRTDTANANNYIVGNTYLKSYVATHTTNYLADTSGGAGTKPALLSKNSGWMTTGNTGTTVGTNFIGTNDAKAFEIKVDAQKAGWIDYTTPSNTTFGFEAGNAITTGIGNTANGYLALFSNITGSSNSALGRYAGYNNTKSGNTFIGDSAGYNNTTGTFNTYLGYAAGTATGFATVSNTTCLGHTSGVSATTIASNAIYLGNSSITKIYGEVTSISAYSDRRIKDNIKENVPGLAFITKLHPVTYNINLTKENNLLGVKDEQNWEGKYDIEKITQSGFIAQQVDSAAQSCGYDFNGLNKPKTPDGLYSLGYTDFVVPLVKAVQELNEKNDSLTIANNELKTQINELTQSEQKQDIRSTNDENQQTKDEKEIAELKAMISSMNQAQASMK